MQTNFTARRSKVNLNEGAFEQPCAEAADVHVGDRAGALTGDNKGIRKMGFVGFLLKADAALQRGRIADFQLKPSQWLSFLGNVHLCKGFLHCSCGLQLNHSSAK